jgi:folate/biopterin transporter
MEPKLLPSRNSVVISLIALSNGMIALADLPLSYLYKDDFKLSPAKVALLVSLINLPWIIKPLWGFISDCFPIFGKRRSPYLLFFGVLGICCWISLGLIIDTLLSTFLILLLIQITVCFCNVIGEALVVEESQKTSNTQQEASKYVTLFFGVRAVGTILTAYTGGLLLEVVDKKVIFLIAVICPLLLVISSVIMVEEPMTAKPIAKEQFIEIYKFITRKEVYPPIIFILVFCAIPSCSDTMFFYYTNELKFEPEFMGKMKMAYGVGTIIGMIIYYSFLHQYDFKIMLIVTTFICSFISLSQLLLVTRLSLVLGIPDELFAVFCSFIVQFTAELNMLPLLVLCCRICPKNIEGSLYALLMSTMNFGSMLSSQGGGLLMLVLGITQTNFERLWMLILISGVLMIAPLPMLYFVENADKPSEKKGYELV